MSAEPHPPIDTDEPVRPHSYDGIQEYDKRLPNWWLFTLHGSIVFALLYWFYFHREGAAPSGHEVFRREMEAVQAARMANSLGNLSDAQMWEMSRNSQIVAAGKATFAQNCVQCHLASLRGKDESPTAQGPNLADNVWIHGARPNDLRNTVTKGVTTPTASMPPWGPLLGDRKIVEVVSYVLSHHEPPKPAEGGATP